MSYSVIPDFATVVMSAYIAGVAYLGFTQIGPMLAPLAMTPPALDSMITLKNDAPFTTAAGFFIFTLLALMTMPLVLGNIV